MNLERLLVRLRQTLLMVGGGLGLVGAVLAGISFLLDQSPSDSVQVEALACVEQSDCGPVSYAFQENSPAALTGAAAIATPSPTPAPTLPRPPQMIDPAEPDFGGAGSGAASDTLPVSASVYPTRPVVPTPSNSTTTSLELSTDLIAEESYTSTVQVHSRDDSTADVGRDSSEAVAAGLCPTSSSASFELVTVVGPPPDHPDLAHPDLNLTLRGYAIVPEPLELVEFSGDTDPDAPQLAALFQPNRAPSISAVYRVNDWLWASAQCGGRSNGCPGGLLDAWAVTLVGLATRPGEPLAIPARHAEIFAGGFKALVLYADERQITLGYSRRDSVAGGYVVHLLDVCVDPNLLALYRAQNDANGWRASGRLPALRNGQFFGAALGNELKISIRDSGSFMDPRSAKDWWRGY